MTFRSVSQLLTFQVHNYTFYMLRVVIEIDDEILCYGQHRIRLLWHSPHESRGHSTSENKGPPGAWWWEILSEMPISRKFTLLRGVEVDFTISTLNIRHSSPYLLNKNISDFFHSRIQLWNVSIVSFLINLNNRISFPSKLFTMRSYGWKMLG